MINDIVTVLRKEWKEVCQLRGIKGYLFNWILMVLLIGVYMPLQVGTEWFASPMILLLWSWPGLQLISGLVADAFAGEKERHTLETLLASRLPDASIFTGKMLTGLIYAGSLFPASLLVAAITLNLAHKTGTGLMFYDPGMLLAVIGLHWLSLILIASIGMLVSMKSDSVKSAYQKIAIAILVIALAPSLLIGVVSPDLKAQFMQWIALPQLGYGAWIAAAGLFGVDVLLFAIGLASFKRPRLLTA